MAFNLTGVTISPTNRTRGLSSWRIRLNTRGVPINKPPTNTTNLNNTTNLIKENLPSIFSLYPITGSITISRRFNGHPSANLVIIANNDNLSSIRAYFKNRDNKIVLWNIPFRVAGYTENSLPNRKTESGRIEITVQLEGYWQKLLNYSYRLGGSYNNAVIPNDQFPKKTDLDLNKIIVSPTKIDNYNYLDIAKFANKHNIPITGQPTYLIQNELSKLSNPIGIQIESALSSIANDNGYYNIFSLQDSIKVKKWDLEYDSFNLQNILEVSYSQNPEITVPPSELTWLSLNNEETEKKEDAVRNSKPYFTYNPPQTYTVSDPFDPTEASNCPDNITLLRDLSLNFDLSGERRIHTITTYLGTAELEKITTVYGFAYTSQDVVTSNGTSYYIRAAAASYWKPIEYTRTIYKYDDQYGYLISISTQGWRLGRFKTETEKYEVWTYAGSDDAKKRAIRNSCIFRRIPIIAKEEFLLKQYRDYYKDLGNGEEAYVFWEDYDKYGNAVRRSIPNPAYVPPMFIYQSRSYYNSFDFFPNPDNIGRAISVGKPLLPDLTTGEIKTTITNVTIFKSSNTVNSTNDGLEQSLGSNLGNALEDTYSTTTIIQSAQDANFTNSLQISTPVVSSGRPPQAIFLPKPYQLVQSKPALPKTNRNSNKKSKGTFVPILYTEPYSPDHIASSMQYGVRSYDKALDAANISLQINKTFGEEPIDVQCLFSPQIKEGDMVLVNYNGEQYKTRVAGVNHAIVIEGKGVIEGRTALSLGVISEEKYKLGNVFKKNLTEEQIEENKRRVPPADNFNFYNRGLTIGDLSPVYTLMSSTKNRGNY